MAPIFIQPFHCLGADAFNGVHHLSTAALSLVLSDTAPDPTDLYISDIVEIVAGGGYTAGGLSVATQSSSHISGVYRLILEAFLFTATDVVADWQYIVLTNTSTPLGNLIGFYDIGAPFSMIEDDIFNFNFSDVEGVFRNQVLTP